MKLSEFRELTKDVDGDVEIVLGKDAEGNAYHPLAEVNTGSYVWEPKEYELYCIADRDDIDSSDLNGAEPAIVLWPVS